MAPTTAVQKVSMKASRSGQKMDDAMVEMMVDDLV